MVWRVRAVWTGLAGAPYLSTFYLSQIASPSAEDAHTEVQVALTQTQDWWSNDLSVTLDTEVVAYTNPDSPESVTAVTAKPAIAGTSAATECARATQGLLRFRTGAYIGAREVRGRMFVPGVTTAFLGTQGRPTQAYRTGIQNGIGQLMLDGLQIPSRKSNLFYDVTSVTAWDEFAVLRSRRD